MKKFVYLFCMLICFPGIIKSQENSKAWEFGLGFNVQQLERATVKNFSQVSGEYNLLQLDNRTALYGFNIYIARELNSHFFIDFQSNFDFASDPVEIGNKNRFTISPSLGLQWRLGSYMKNKVIDPFVRVGIGYQYRNFNPQSYYDVTNNVTVVEGKAKSLSPIQFGAGSNLWITDRWGIGLEADYLVNPQSGVQNQWQGIVRLTYRLGGAPKICF